MSTPIVQDEAATGNTIATDKEVNEAQQSVNPSETQPVVAAPTQEQPQQASQPIAATTSAGLTAPKPKADHTATDATIQGLLVQVIALQHNKIQQLSNNE